MITTYLIENVNDKSVFNYYARLWHAKEDLKSLGADWNILCLKGQAYGEGYHWYKVILKDGKFIKVSA